MQRVIEVGDKVPKRGNAFFVWLGKLVLWLLGWRIVGEIPNVPKAVVIGAPHTSNVDGLVAAASILALRLKLNVMAKAELFRWPFGYFWRFLGVIPVDRANAHGLVRASLQKFEERDQLFVGIAPEGTRKGAAKWKMGFYHIAKEAGVPVVVGVLDYGRKEVRLALTLFPGDDEVADMEKIMACYQSAQPARPERLSLPLKQMAESSRQQ